MKNLSPDNSPKILPAMKVLARGGTLFEAAQAAGFDDLEEFKTHHKKVTGVWPEEVKRKPASYAYKPSCPDAKFMTKLPFIEQQLRDTNSQIREIAEKTGIPVSKISTLFRLATGMTPREYRSQHQQAPESSSREWPRKVKQAIIRMNKGEAYADIAQALGYPSEDTWVRLFKKETGKTPHALKREGIEGMARLFEIFERIDTARELLGWGNTLKDAAAGAGYQSVSQMNSAFRRHYGLSASEKRFSEIAALREKSGITEKQERSVPEILRVC